MPTSQRSPELRSKGDDALSRAAHCEAAMRPIKRIALPRPRRAPGRDRGVRRSGLCSL